jgi:site-specific DNA recombinase
MRATQITQERKVIGYCRVSTEKQADRGVSLDAQVSKIQAMAVVQGSEVAEIITDAGESAKSLLRPGMGRLLAMVDGGQVQTVIIAKLDRLTRSVKDLGEILERFQRRNVSLVSVAESLDTGSAAGRLVLNVMASVSQWEREAIGERTASALQYKKANRRVYSPTPYGFEREGDTLVPVVSEQAVIARIRLLHCNGHSLRKIAAALNQDGAWAGVGSRDGQSGAQQLSP